MAEAYANKTPRDVLRVAFRRWRMFLAAAGIFAVAAFQGAKLLPLKYTGTTVFERRSDVAGGDTRGSETFETMKLTLKHELAGRNAVELIAEELGLLEGLPHDSEGLLTRDGEMAKQRIVKGLVDSIRIDWPVRNPNVDLIHVSVTHSDRKLARLIPDALVRSYINQVSETIIQRLTDSRAFLLGRVEKCNSRLSELLKQKTEFERDHAGMMPEDPGALQERIRQTTSNIEAQQLRIDTARLLLARLRPMQQQPDSAPSTQPVQTITGPNPELKRQQDMLSDAREELARALNEWGLKEKHWRIEGLKAKIERLEKTIASLPKEVELQRVFDTGGRHSDGSMAVEAEAFAAQSEIDTAQRELGRLRTEKEKLEALMGNFAQARQGYVDIVSKVDQQQAELAGYQKAYEDVQRPLAAEVASRRTHLSAIQAAQEQERPSSPSLMLVVAFALAGGLGFGGALVFLSNFLDRSIGTAEEAIRFFDVPVHGIISEISSQRQQTTRWVRTWIVQPAAATILAGALAVSALSVVLWLQYPTKYKDWSETPVRFLVDAASGLGRSSSGSK